MSRNTTRALACALVLLSPVCAWAADGGSEGRSFGGLRFGAGLSVTFDTGSNERVESAEIVDGLVRVTEEKNVITRILLETHYFFPATSRAFLGIKEPGTWAWGPFVGVQSSTDDVIDAFAMGLMVGFRKEAEGVEEKAAEVRAARLALETDREALKAAARSMRDDRAAEVNQSEAALATAQRALSDTADEGGASSFNIGIGAVVDPRVQVLGDGFVENQPPPGTETEVRYKTTDQWGVVVLFSFSF
jgi:hypothetical protein